MGLDVLLGKSYDNHGRDLPLNWSLYMSNSKGASPFFNPLHCSYTSCNSPMRPQGVDSTNSTCYPQYLKPNIIKGMYSSTNEHPH